MKRFFVILTILLFIIPSCRRNTGYVMIQGYAQGGTYMVKLNMEGIRMTPEAIQEGVDSIFTLIDTTLSGYNKGSILSSFNRGEKIRPNALFIDMYSLAYSWYEKTEGALDCAAGPVFDLWGFGFTNGEMPTDGAIRSALESSGMGRLSKDMEAVIGPDGFLNPMDMIADGGAQSNSAGWPILNFNAIAQGLSADMVATYLEELGVKDMLVDIGEIFCCGVNPDGKPWSVGIDRPVDGNNSPGADLEGIWKSKGIPCGIVTSGNYRKFYVRDGRKYAHTIDPRTGYPADNGLLSATVIAPDAASADALATLCMVLGPDSAKDLVLSLPEIEACLISSAPSDSMLVWSSPGF